ncbi:S-layer homology domain-containing protein [Collinsella ihumii]|uniref:S-layer homology domain-containing protein n=1 Tax=Collinsella ihumii TaxID=1720204 RepID=A0AAW7JUY5_9ACTN|nr:S-layer homology domain-containing protein [Collinsella ihumii]MDN0070142.1 S-layer homology domain-containing protein [Collinsella ihumii]
MKQRIVSILLTLALCLSMLPATAFAAGTGTDTGKAIQLGTSGIAGYDSAAGYDYIYFGSWTAQDTYTTSGPIKWRVLDDQTNTGETGLFLLSDGLLGTGYYGGVYFDNTSPYSNTWQGSDAQAWCNTFASSNLDSRELAAILETTKSDVVFTSSTYSVPFAASENILNGDKVFFLSAEEAENSAYGFANDNARIANYGGSACAWWLRSPYAGYTDGAGAVYGYGYVDFITVNDDWAARPAFNLDLTSVLFTSAAAGGKIPAASSGGNQGGEAGDAIFEIGDYDGSEWKLTLLDNSRNFAVTEEAASGKPGDTITLNYTGATTGTNEYISVIIADSSGAQYYGRVAQPAEASGTAEVTIPAGLAAGTYTLYVFSEQYNGGEQDDTKLTDYASAFETVALTVSSDTTAPTLTPGSATRNSDTTATVKFTSSEAGTYYYAVVESGDTAPTIDTTGEGTSCISGEQTISLTSLSGAGAKDIYIVAKDAAGNVSQSLKIEIPAYTVVPKTYTLTVDLNGGSGSTIGDEYTAGEVVNIDAGSRSNYRFDRWTSSNGGSFADLSSASTTFTMPAVDTTITANWRYIGGGTTPSNPTKTPSQQAVDKIEDAKDGDTVEIALPAGQTTLDKEVFETLAGRDVTLEVSVPGGAVWTVHGTDIPENAALVDIGMGVSMGTSTIPVDLINAVTGEVGTVQLTLQHDGPFGFTMTLTAPVGAENAGLWANLYHYDEDAGRMAYRSSAVVGADGNASLPFDHAGQYALVLDDKSHELPFTDLEDGAWYLDAVGYAYRHDLMGGYGGTSLFGPDDGLLREQAAQVVWNLMGEGDGSRPAAPHADVAQGRWYSPAVNWAVDAKVMDGYDADTFGVGDALTREQFAAVVAKAAGADVSAADAASLDVFSDTEDVSGWAVQTMAWAVEAGVIEGVEGEDGSRSLDATRALTRAEMAAMMMNAVDKGALALPSKQNA